MAETTHRVITTGIMGLNVRTGPAVSYPKIGTLDPGEEVTVTATANEWSRIEGPRLYGYSYAPYLEPIPGTTGEVTIYYKIVAPEGISVKLVPESE